MEALKRSNILVPLEIYSLNNLTVTNPRQCLLTSFSGCAEHYISVTRGKPAVTIVTAWQTGHRCYHVNPRMTPVMYLLEITGRNKILKKRTEDALCWLWCLMLWFWQSVWSLNKCIAVIIGRLSQAANLCPSLFHVLSDVQKVSVFYFGLIVLYAF